MERRQRRAVRSQEATLYGELCLRVRARRWPRIRLWLGFPGVRLVQAVSFALGEGEFLPFYCYLDFAYSHVYGLGLTRMETLAQGYLRCNHRFKGGRTTMLYWPPPFVKG